MADNLKGIPFNTDNEGIDFPEMAKRLVYDWARGGLAVVQEHPTFSLDEVYIVSFTYILGNWKALVSTSLPDGRYYEVTYKPEHDGSDGPACAYIDTYIKTHNVEVAIG